MSVGTGPGRASCVRAQRSGRSRVCLVHGTQSQVVNSSGYYSLLQQLCPCPRDGETTTQSRTTARSGRRSGPRGLPSSNVVVSRSCVRMTSQLLRSVHRRVGTPGSAWRLEDDVVCRAGWTKVLWSRRAAVGSEPVPWHQAALLHVAPGRPPPLEDADRQPRGRRRQPRGRRRQRALRT